jgi:orotate phosphoribosyltransferase
VHKDVGRPLGSSITAETKVSVVDRRSRGSCCTDLGPRPQVADYGWKPVKSDCSRLMPCSSTDHCLCDACTVHVTVFRTSAEHAGHAERERATPAPALVGWSNELEGSNVGNVFDWGRSTGVLRKRMDRATLVERYQRSLLDSGALRVSTSKPFTLRNGTRSRIYIDHGEVLCEPTSNGVLISAMMHYIASNFRAEKIVLVNVDSKSSPQITGAIAAIGGYRQVVVLPDAVRQAEKATERRFRLPLSLSPDDEFLIVDDVLTPGDLTAVNVALALRDELRQAGFGRTGDAHAEPTFRLLVALARNPAEGGSILEENAVEPHWLTTLTEVISASWDSLDGDERNLLATELCAPT